MRCSACTTDNPAGARFCHHCGTALQSACPTCGTELVPNARFCSHCGTPLQADAMPSAAPTNSGPVSFQEGGERRHLTVLFCDLVGSTALASSMDPEDWRTEVASYHRKAADVITRFGGHVAKYLGDGVMAFFGWPQAHDNDAERAVRAGLAMLEPGTQLNGGTAHPKLAARIGIDSGTVVVGTGATAAADVFGDTPNIAARVQSAAEPDSVLVSSNTHDLIRGLFVVEDRGAQALKGIAEPFQLYRILRPSGARGRLEAAATSRGLTPFVGREDELRTLTHRWERVREGEGQAALIIGEAGIGKSRLLHRFRETLTDTPHTWIAAATGAFYQNTPFYPVSEMLRQMVLEQSLDRLDHYLRERQNGGPPNAVPDEQFAQLLAGLALAGLKSDETIPLVAPLLNLPLPANFPPSTLLPEQQRRRLLAILVEWVLCAARAQPLIIALEDLHWADPSTLELIQLLAEQGHNAPLMMLYTARPEFHAPWPMRAHHAQINLNRLIPRDIRTMVAQIAAQKALADDTVAAMVERTGGVPLFVEELTRAVLESGDGKPGGRTIPATLHDSLMARLDRLGPAKEIIQVAAVLGSDFSYELLHAVYPITEAELQQALDRLADAELLYVRGLAPDATYQFKHALIRDAAYEALLKSRRKDLHLSVARAIDSWFPELKETHPEVLARHWTEAGEIEPAIAEWTRAGKSAESRNAFAEAAKSYQEALAVLKLQAESVGRDCKEIAILTTLADAVVMTSGYAAAEYEHHLTRRHETAQRLGDTTQIFYSLVGISVLCAFRLELSRAQAIGWKLLSIANNEHDADMQLEAHGTLANILWLSGDLISSREHSEQGLALFTHKQHRSLGKQHLGTACQFYACLCTAALGFPDKALGRALEFLARARERVQLLPVAFALNCVATILVWRREGAEALKYSDALLALATEHGFSNWHSFGQILHGQSFALLGKADDAIADIKSALESFEATGAAVPGWMYSSLAFSYFAASQPQEGKRVVDKAFLVADNTGDAEAKPELHRLMGELVLMADPTEAASAEASFRLAIEAARKQYAKLPELRATLSLARLLASQGRRDEAHTMLAEIYNWFTEGFDTADLKDAKSLLSDLST